MGYESWSTLAQIFKIKSCCVFLILLYISTPACIILALNVLIYHCRKLRYCVVYLMNDIVYVVLPTLHLMLLYRWEKLISFLCKFVSPYIDFCNILKLWLAETRGWYLWKLMKEGNTFFIFDCIGANRWLNDFRPQQLAHVLGNHLSKQIIYGQRYVKKKSVINIWRVFDVI